MSAALDVLAPPAPDRLTGAHLAELVAALSLAGDLGIGQPMDHVLRSCVLAAGLGRALGLSEAEQCEVYDVALLRRVGCVADSHEGSHFFGDELLARAELVALDDHSRPRMAAFAVRRVGQGRPLATRLRLLAELLAALPGAMDASAAAHCDVARSLAGELGFEGPVIESLAQLYEWWDGSGHPAGVAHERLRMAARIVPLAGDAEVFHRLGGVEAATAMVAGRAGSQYDPALAEAFIAHAPELFALVDEAGSWDAVIEAEPVAPRYLTERQLDAALLVMADFVDLKSPVFTGHSRGVAERAAAAAEAVGLGDRARLLWHAGLVHDLGRAGVANSIWEKPGPLTEWEWERVRLHAYLGERMLARVGHLAEVSEVAAAHHERLDGSGYHHGRTAGDLSIEQRLLAAADVRQALGEERPHRPALSPADAARLLRDEVRAGRLDGEAVEAVMESRPRRRRRAWPAGLTAREVEVLGLVATGRTNKEIAKVLVVSPRTVGHHLQHIYRKLGVSTRAGATLFAMQHGLS